MLLSIIIPVYNVSEFLSDCLNPLIDVQKVLETEIILINDGSTDSSLELASSFNGKLKNLIIIDQKNSGVSATRNRGVEIAKGDYVFFYDGDDIIIPQAFVNFVKRTSELRLDMSCGNGFTLKDSLEKRIKKDEFRSKLGIVTGPQYYIQSINNREACPTVWLYMYKRSFLEKNKITFLNTVSLHEDDLFIARCLSLASSVCYIPEYFYLYRYREQSAINRYAHKFLDTRSTISLVKILIHLKPLRESAKGRSLEVLNILTFRLLRDLFERYIYFKKNNHKELQIFWINHYQTLPKMNLPQKLNIKLLKYWIRFYAYRIF